MRRTTIVLGSCACAAAVAFGPTPAAAQDHGAERGSIGWWEYLESERLEQPTVESASKREQPLLDAPADITVIDGAELRTMGVDNVAEALRRAPGVHVMQMNGNVFSVGVRGVNRLANNQVLVLVDGRPIQDIVQGSPHWGALPLHMGDLERVEVLHGPGSTVYGANAMSGVVSMSTKRPLDHLGYEAWLGAGMYASRDETVVDGQRTRLQNSGTGYAAYGWANASRTLGVRASAGFSSAPEWRDAAASTVAVHGNYHYYGRVAAQYKPDDDLEVFTTASVSSSEYENTFALTSLILNIENVEEAWTGRIKRRGLLGFADLTVDANAQHLVGETHAINENGTLSGVRVTSYGASGAAQLDMTLAGGTDVLTLGVEGGFNETRDFEGIDPGRQYIAAIVQNEWLVWPKPRILVSTGVRAERLGTDDGAGTETVYRNLMPRAAIVANFDNQQAVRVGVATSYRTPVPLENYVELARADTDDSGPDAIAFAKNLDLRPTRVTGVELGYRGHFREALRVSTTGFAQRVTDEIGTSGELRLPLRWDNLYDIDEVGASAALEYRPGRTSRVWGHYTYTHAKRSDTDAKYREWPTHIAGIGAMTLLPKDLLVSGHVSAWSSIAPDTLVRTGDTLDRARAEVAPQVIGTVRLSHAIANGNGELFLGLRNVGGLFREQDDMRQFASELVQPIGSSVLLGITLTEGKGQ